MTQFKFSLQSGPRSRVFFAIQSSFGLGHPRPPEKITLFWKGNHQITLLALDEAEGRFPPSALSVQGRGFSFDKFQNPGRHWP